MPSAAVASAAVASVPGEGLSSSAPGSAGQEPRGWAGDTGPWGGERSALMSHAEARGAGNGNFWAALFIRRSRYDPSSRLPHCPEGNSSLSWCQWGWGGDEGRPQRGLAAVTGDTVLPGGGLWGAQQCQPLSTLPGDTSAGSSSSAERAWGWAARLPHGCPVPRAEVSSGDRDTGSVGPAAGRGCGRDTGSPGDARAHPSRNWLLISQPAG